MNLTILVKVLLLLGGLLGAMAAAGQAEPVNLRGELTQGGVVFGRAEPGSRLTLDGKPVRLSASGDFVLGFDRDAAPQARLTIVSPQGVQSVRVLNIARRQYDIQRINGLPRDQVTPPPEVMERIRREAELAARAREQDNDRPFFASGFRWPVKGRISGVYGSQRILNGESRQPHYGVDIAVPAGTPVTAPADGVVTLAHPGMYFSGKTLIIDHGHGLSSSLLHLQDIQVVAGQQVRQGQVVASVGATGRVSGAHLDWRMNWFTARVDPALLAPPM